MLALYSYSYTGHVSYPSYVYYGASDFYKLRRFV